jgi:hypothetical protein
MKIQGTGMMPHLERFQSANQRPSVRSDDQPAAAGDVQVTGGARFVAEVRAEASTFSEVRANEVARARQDVATGQVLTEAEIEAAVDSLLAGL